MKLILTIAIVLCSFVTISQQSIILCEDETSKTFNYSTSASQTGTYHWFIDNQPVTETDSELGISWVLQDVGTHLIEVYFQNENGCVSSFVSLPITIDTCSITSMFVPNCFTPNGDFANNTWQVKGENYTDAYLYIVNRWGEVMFES